MRLAAVFAACCLSLAPSTSSAQPTTFNVGAQNDPFIHADLADPHGIAISSVGDIAIADAGKNVVRWIDHATGVQSTIAGTGHPTFNGHFHNDPRRAALSSPAAVAFDRQDNLIIADTGNDLIRWINRATGELQTIIGRRRGAGFHDDQDEGWLASPAAQISLDNPRGLAVDSSNNIIVADTRNHRIVRYLADTQTVEILAGTGERGPVVEGSIPAAQAQFSDPMGVAVLPSGSVLIADSGNDVVRIVEFSARGQTVSTFAGRGSLRLEGWIRPIEVENFLDGPQAVAVDGVGRVLIADTWQDRILRIDPAAIAKKIGEQREHGGPLPNIEFEDIGAGLELRLSAPRGIAAGRRATLISDTGNKLVRIAIEGSAQDNGAGTPRRPVSLTDQSAVAAVGLLAAAAKLEPTTFQSKLLYEQANDQAAARLTTELIHMASNEKGYDERLAMLREELSSRKRARGSRRCGIVWPMAIHERMATVAPLTHLRQWEWIQWHIGCTG